MKKIISTIMTVFLLQGCEVAKDVKDSELTQLGVNAIGLIKGFKKEGREHDVSKEQTNKAIYLYASLISQIDSTFELDEYATILKAQIKNEGISFLSYLVLGTIQDLDVKKMKSLIPYYIKVIEIYHPELSELLENELLLPEEQIGRFPSSVKKISGPFVNVSLQDCKNKCSDDNLHLSETPRDVFETALFYSAAFSAAGALIGGKEGAKVFSAIGFSSGFFLKVLEIKNSIESCENSCIETTGQQKSINEQTEIINLHLEKSKKFEKNISRETKILRDEIKSLRDEIIRLKEDEKARLEEEQRIKEQERQKQEAERRQREENARQSRGREPGDRFIDHHIDRPAREKVVRDPVEKPAKEPVEKPVREPIDRPAREPVEKPIIDKPDRDFPILA